MFSSHVNRRQLLLLAAGSIASFASRQTSATRAATTRLEGPLPDPARARLVWSCAAQGYVAREYLLHGPADIYDSVSMADAIDTNTRDHTADQARREFPLRLLASEIPYVTRLLVYAPGEAKRFSGNVIVESTHPIGGGAQIVWSQVNSAFMRNGDAYVAVAHPVTLKGLAAADPDRYGALKAAHPSQLWGMLADTARELKARHGSRLLGGWNVRRCYLTGYSFTGVACATFANYHHDRARLADGRPVFDGYVPMANAMYVRPLDVPVIRINTQSDFNSFGGLNNRASDSDAAIGKFRHYEVAGTAHVFSNWEFANSATPPTDPPIAVASGQPHIDAKACMARFPQGHEANDLPLSLITMQAFSNLYAWVEHGTAPPRAPRLEIDEHGQARLDEAGNAVGGVRLPQMAVPVAAYGVGAGDCFLFGYKLPFDPSRRRALYGSRTAYVSKISIAAQMLSQQGLIADSGIADVVRHAEAEPDF